MTIAECVTAVIYWEIVCGVFVLYEYLTKDPYCNHRYAVRRLTEAIVTIVFSTLLLAAIRVVEAVS